MSAGAVAMADAGLSCLVEARRRAQEGIGEPIGADDQRRLEVAITAAHAVCEPPSAPTDELRAMGLWWDEEGVGVTLTAEEAEAVFHYINGDSHMIGIGVLDAIVAKVAPEGFR